MIIGVLSSEANAPVDQDAPTLLLPVGALQMARRRVRVSRLGDAHLTRFPRRPTLSA